MYLLRVEDRDILHAASERLLRLLKTLAPHLVVDVCLAAYVVVVGQSAALTVLVLGLSAALLVIPRSVNLQGGEKITSPTLLE